MIPVGQGLGHNKMKALLIAFAMLFASQAGAATVAPSGGTPGEFAYSLGTVDYNTSVYGGWRLYLTVNGTALPGFYFGAKSTPMEDPNGKVFLFTPTGNPASVTVSGVLHRYINPGYQTPTYDPLNTMPYMKSSKWFPDNPLLNTTNHILTIDAVTYSSFAEETPVPDKNALTQRITLATPVPIGGTLPLMLTALGLGGWMLRARTKAA